MKEKATIAIMGALDTKGEDIKFLADLISQQGHKTLIIDVGVFESSTPLTPDVSSESVAEAGGVPLKILREKKDKALAMKVMQTGAVEVVKKLYYEGKFQGIVAIGGSAGTAIGTAAMRALPLGVPKLMVSTIASGDVRAFVGTKDICMMHSVVDIAGLNQISAKIYSNAAGAIVGMVEAKVPKLITKPLVAASMFGNTTPAVSAAKRIMEDHGYEVLVFHATGVGGRTMEELIDEGYIVGVLDITTTELADELVGGVLSAGPDRLEAAGRKGIPQVVAPGCLDMVNFWGRETVPKKFEGRKFYEWNPNVTLMRTTEEENRKLGLWIAEKLNRAKGPVAVFLPLKGVSMLDAPGEEFWDPKADAALYESLKKNLKSTIEVYEMDCNINDPEFARAMAEKLLDFLKNKGG
ncbi:MAG: Tm-1-like ATP-binding domain-containing protein [Nitrososphaerota archaeon]